MKYHNILATIGNTPHVRINNLFGTDTEVYIKLEKQLEIMNGKKRGISLAVHKM